MEAFPPEYVEHNLPLVVLSGLGERSKTHHGPQTPKQESGTRIVTASQECHGDRAGQLLDQFLNQDGSQLPWNAGALPGPSGFLKYRMKAIGRTYTLPARKAAPLPQSASAEGFGTHRSVELHSTLSPLSPGSPIFGDGLFTPLYLAKHQQQVPALLVAFFEISGNDSTAQNEQIQIDINAIRTALSRSGFKTRFAAVLMSDKSILHAPELEDRLSEIRRATTLDPKHGLFFMPPMTSRAEIGTFVQTLLSTLQPLVIEHYRELTKHARRKKIRGGPAPSVTSPVTGSSQSLSTLGWNVRYETKQGVFAEFRQEMDVAERHFSAAIEDLFNPEGIFEATPSWSPRWNEARLLCDALALRVLRCELWAGLTSSAALSWVNYRARMRDLLDRRGKGTQTYSWDAWEARWAEIMAQLLQRAQLPRIHPTGSRDLSDSSELPTMQVYAPPEKITSTTDRLPPFHLLHHPGYWLRSAVDSARARRAKALLIPEEDRTPPGQSPASAVAQRAKSYDVYLVPDPHKELPLPGQDGYDHIADIRRLTHAAVKEFDTRGHIRSTERLQLNFALELIKSEQYTEALDVLMPLWDESSWRDDDWDELFEQVLVTTHECACRSGNGEVLLAAAWELLRALADTTPLSHIGLSEHLESYGIDVGRKIRLSIQDRQRLSPFDCSFTFLDPEGHVGDRVKCQLSLRSSATRDSASIVCSRLEVVLTSGMSISIQHEPDTALDVEENTITDLSDTRVEGAHQGLRANMSLGPGQTRFFNFSFVFREAQEARVERVTYFIEADNFELQHCYTSSDLLKARSLAIDYGDRISQLPVIRPDGLSLKIHPKPPKMELLVHGLHMQHYTNEMINLRVVMSNEEDEEVNVTTKFQLLGAIGTELGVRWSDEEPGVSEVNVGSLDASASRELGLLISAPPVPHTCSVAIEVRYTLASDPSTLLMKTLTLDLDFIAPLEAKYSFGPLLHTEPWPSFFDAQTMGSEEAPAGILHRWRLNTQLDLLATETLFVRQIALLKLKIVGDARCTIHTLSEKHTEQLTSDQPLEWSAELLTQKFSLDDRRPTALELALEVTWSRKADSSTVITTLPVPRLTVPSSEPRVLCTVSAPSSQTNGLSLQYHLENPSLHFLTFALTMEANDDFAFSGAKYRTLSIAPLSRLRVDYHLLMHERKSTDGDYWIWPVLQVVDSYYHKNLRTHAAGPRVKLDEKRGLGVLVEEME